MGEFITPFVAAAAYQIGGLHTAPRHLQTRANTARIEEIGRAVDTLLLYDGDIVMSAAIEISRAARRGHRLPVRAAIQLARAPAVTDWVARAASDGPFYLSLIRHTARDAAESAPSGFQPHVELGCYRGEDRSAEYTRMTASEVARAYLSAHRKGTPFPPARCVPARFV